jgi:hypothetical protein
MTHVSKGRHGARGEGKRIIDADGIAVMINDDGSVVIDAYSNGGDAVRLHIDPEDAASQAHVFAAWSRLRHAFKPADQRDEVL